MATALEMLERIIPHSATKIVSKSDAEKAAMYMIQEFKEIMAKAGHYPRNHEEEILVPLVDPITRKDYQCSYYDSERKGSGRPFETRLGQGIFDLVLEGDTVFLGTDGETVFVRRVVDADRVENTEEAADEIETTLLEQLDARTLAELAEEAPRKPKKIVVSVEQPVRNPAVKAYVIRRCEGKCEVPGCGWIGFQKDDGSRFIQVHHIDPLGNNGDDTILNCIGICPNCHARAHYGPDRKGVQKIHYEAVRYATERYKAFNDLP